MKDELEKKIERFNKECEKVVSYFLENLAMIFICVCSFSAIGVLVALLIYSLIKYATRS